MQHAYALHSVLDALSYYSVDVLEIKENINIRCPYLDHKDDSPSCTVNLLNGLWYCHGCDRGGNYEQLVRVFETAQLGEPPDDWELVLTLAAIRLGHKNKNREHLISINIVPHVRTTKSDERALFLSEEFFFNLKQPHWKQIEQHYLYERDFRPQSLIDFDVRINHSSEYSVVIPIYQQGIFMGYTSRKAYDCAKDETKYWHSPGMHKSEIVFGDLKSGTVLVVEGPLDKIMAHQLGFKNVACTFGWHMSETQARHIKKYAKKIIDAQDNDEKGEEGAKRSRELIPEVEHQRFVFPNRIKDIGSMSRYKHLFSMNLYYPFALVS